MRRDSAKVELAEDDSRYFSWDNVDIIDVDSDAWVEIPGGTFMMGAEMGVPRSTEPVHRVTVTTFRMSRFPITNEQYVVYLRENPGVRVPPQLSGRKYYGGPRELRDSIRFGWERHPVTNVSWHEAMAYVRWLDSKVEGHMDLPSEAQWEFAARGVEGRKYPWGNRRPSPSRAAYGSRSGSMPSVLRLGPTAGPGWAGYRVPVDQYPRGATPEGVYDLAGNVWEWVADCVHRAGYEGAPDDGSEWGGGVCDRQAADARLLRGGSWRSAAVLLHAARRSSALSEERTDWFGFRVVWKPEGERQPQSSQGEQQTLYYPKQLTATAPDTFTTHFETTEGLVSIRVYRDWAPNSADRFYNLVVNGFYDGNRIYRGIEGVLAQWGLNGNRLVNYHWRVATIPKDPALQSNTRGRVSMARAIDDKRKTEILINLRANLPLDEQEIAPFGEVVWGMDVAERYYSEYGDGPKVRGYPPGTDGTGPNQNSFELRGDQYVAGSFPNLSRVVRAWVETEGR